MSMGIDDKLYSKSTDFSVKEKLIGKGALQPFNYSNSASRKIMFGAQLDQNIGTINPEVADIQTGYEIKFGKESTSLITAEDDYVVIGKIPKFRYLPEQNYYLILKSKTSDSYRLVHKVDYTHNTESYGYLNNVEAIKKLSIGSEVSKGTILRKSNNFDDVNNRKDGVNFRIAYMALANGTEDSIVISQSAADKVTSPMINKISMMINENDMPLNLYGTYNNYKSFSDIGEHVKDNIVAAIRRDNKQDTLYSQSYERMSTIMISDEKYIADGVVVDIDIQCNNPDILKGSYYNNQLLFYYEQSMEFYNTVSKVLGPIAANRDNKCSNELLQLAFLAKRVLNKELFKNDRPFSNTIITITTVHLNPLRVGDKLTDRFGGKGVVGLILPDFLMPKLDNGEYADMIANKLGVPNRENPGQLFESSLTFISGRILEKMKLMYNSEHPAFDVDEQLEDYFKFLRIVLPRQAAMFGSLLGDDVSNKAAFLESIMADGSFKLVLDPLSDVVSLSTLEEIYKTFDWIKPYTIEVPIVDSNGNVRSVQARKQLYAGKKYIYRLKQYAEDKFSATSLSATSILNEPTKSKASKNYKSPYPKTPIKFGEMETGDMEHLDIFTVVKNLMIHSVSPMGRRQTEALYTEDPFDVDIDLPEEARNRNVEALNSFMKAIGIELEFIKLPIRLLPAFTVLPFVVHNPAPLSPFTINGIDPAEELVDTICLKREDGLMYPFLITPFSAYK